MQRFPFWVYQVLNIHLQRKVMEGMRLISLRWMPGQQYQLKIVTTDGNEFRSALSNVQISPPIDSLYWNQDSSFNAHVYLNTHDPTNQTRYYRWQYVETWEYHSAFNSVLDYNNGDIIFRPLDNQIYRCYKSVPSSTIEVVSTTQLSSSVVNKYEIAEIPQGSEKISETYSNLVSQYAIPVDAFNFWSNLKRNTEQLGSLFDLQPFTELGNITCQNDPSIHCIGFISFTTLQTKRIIISKNDLVNWNYQPYYGFECIIDTIKPADIDKYFQPPGGPYSNSLIGTANGTISFIFGSLCGLHQSWRNKYKTILLAINFLTMLRFSRIFFPFIHKKFITALSLMICGTMPCTGSFY